MPTVTLAVASEVSKGANWSYSGGAADYTNLQSDDSDTTIIASNDNNGDSRFTLDNLPGSAVVVVAPVTTRHKSRKVNTNNPTLRTNLTDSGGTQNGATAALSSGSYVEVTDTYSTAAAAAVWTPALVNGLDVHLEKTAGGANSGHNTTLLNVDVEYLPGSGGWMSLVVELLGPVLGAALQMRDFLRIEQELLRKRTRLSKSDFERMSYELRNQRNLVLV